jgi:hypothetical protein
VNYIEVEASLPRRVAQEFEAQAGRSELGRGRDGSTQADIRCLKRRKKGKKGGRKENGWHGHTAYPHRRRPIHLRLRRAPPPAHVVVAVFESCMLTMGSKGVGSRELATLAVSGISTSTKSGQLIR